MQSYTIGSRNRGSGFEQQRRSAQLEHCLDLSVSGLKVAVFLDRGDGQNHTTHFLGLEGGGYAQIDMSQGSTGLQGDFQVTIRGDDLRQYHAAAFEYDTAVGCTLRDFLTMLDEREWHQYQFTRDGHGVRYWNLCVTSLYEEGGLVRPNASVDLFKRLLYRWHPTSPQTRASMRPGLFINPVARSMASIGFGMIGRAIAFERDDCQTQHDERSRLSFHDMRKTRLHHTFEKSVRRKGVDTSDLSALVRDARRWKTRLDEAQALCGEIHYTRQDRILQSIPHLNAAPQEDETAMEPVSQPNDPSAATFTLTMRPRNL